MELRKGILLLATIVFASIICEAETLIYSGEKIKSVGRKAELFIDNNGLAKAKTVILENKFVSLESNVPNLGVSSSIKWLKLAVENRTDEDLFLYLPFPTLEKLWVYYIVNGELIDSSKVGLDYPFSAREIEYQDYLFQIPKKKGKVDILFRIENSSQTMFPLEIGSIHQINEKLFTKDHFFGIYAGFILVMLFYNIFIYASTKDRSYLWYLTYIFTVGLTQFTLSGYSHKYLWPNFTWLSHNSVYICGISSGLAVVFFARDFLHTQERAPWFDKTLKIIGASYVLALIFLIIDMPTTSYNLINASAGIGVLILLIGAIFIAKGGYRPAKFFVVAWTVFICTVIIYILKDVNVLPYNDFTTYAMPFGSAIEVVLLSLALADKINILSNQKDKARANELVALKRNEKLIKDQNIMLEHRVTERTTELKKSNDNLESAMVSLKNAQAQLVNQEKMASLGQLTAGIAHEINNPINFVSSNVNPLRRDIDDLVEMISKFSTINGTEDVEERLKEVKAFKEEIDYEYILQEVDMLLKGIDDGATRTAEFVKSLKKFSRLDEVESKFADIHEGIDSTLVILLGGTKQIVEIVKNYDDNIVPIECFPGKLNQVFSNIMVNSLQALKASNIEKPTLTISTKNLEQDITISIADNGPGIPDDIKEKIFEPFFTTKDVGEGTGLGLSIVFSIIESHNGKIEVFSSPANGTEFLITLPKAIH